MIREICWILRKYPNFIFLIDDEHYSDQKTVLQVTLKTLLFFNIQKKTVE